MTDPFQWASATETRAHIVEGRWSAVDVIDACLARIDKLEPSLRAFLHVDREGARIAAQEADAALARGQKPGALHGVPVAIKDDLWVKGMPATSGSLLFANFRPSMDGTVAERLRAAGAIIVGKTNMPEFAAWARSRSFTAGEAANPWDLKRISGASSGGSAAAVASGMVPIAIGSDGGGSIRIPAALTGLVGLFPTLGRVPAYGSFYYSPFGSAGPMARSVTDTALVQQAIAGPDHRIEHALKEDAPDVVGPLEDGVRGLSIGWSPDFGWIPADPRVIETVLAGTQRLAQAGASVHSISHRIEHPWGNGKVMAALHKAIAAAGNPTAPLEDPPATEGIEEWLCKSAIHGQPYFAAPEFIAFTEQYAHLLTPPQQCFGAVSFEDESIPSPDILNALMDELFSTYDLICSPTMATVAPVAPTDWSSAYGDTFMGTNFTFIANATGCPGISVPCGFVDGMPVGLQLIGRRGDEVTVLRAARALEKAVGGLSHATPGGGR